MSAPRRLASSLLHLVARHAARDAREWANAMRGELDAIDGDWAALSWAIGSVCSLASHFGPRDAAALVLGPFGSPSHARWRRLGVGTAELLSGVVVASIIVTIGVLVDLTFLHLSWGQFAQLPLADRLLLVAAIELVFLASVVALPRRRRPLATGIVLAGMTLLLHVATHG